MLYSFVFFFPVRIEHLIIIYLTKETQSNTTETEFKNAGDAAEHSPVAEYLLQFRL